MANVLGIKKAVHRIQLGDESDSPTFTMRLTDDETINRGKAVYEELQLNQAALKRIEAGSEEPEDHETMVRIWRMVIESCLGPDAYDRIVDYIADGEDVEADDMLLLMTPVVLHLLDVLGDVVSANSNEAVLKYARSKQSAATGAI